METNYAIPNAFPRLLSSKKHNFYLSPTLGQVDLFNNTFYATTFFSLSRLFYFKKHYLHTISFYWAKLVFKGKGFRVRKFNKSKKFTFNFGHSHWTKIIFTSRVWRFFRVKPRIYILVISDRFSYQKLSQTIRHVKKINRYTRRGLRFKKQIIIQRFGKISQVQSSLQA